MTRWSIKQKQLDAEYLSNISAGWFLLGVITPFLTGVKIDLLILIKIIISLISTMVLLVSANMILKK